MELLSTREIQIIRDNLIEMKEEISNFKEMVDAIVESFERNEVVQSLYQSGKFGEESQTKVKKIKNGIETYCNTVLYNSDGLFARTYQFLDRQEELNQKGD